MSILDSAPDTMSETLDQPQWHAPLMFSVSGIRDLLRVVRFDGQEAISSLFEYTLHIACENADLSLDDMIGRQAAFNITDSYGHSRTVLGAIHSAAFESVQGRFSFYQFTLVSPFQWLKHRHGFRIFQGQDVPAIVQQVFTDAGLDSQHYRFELKDSYCQREFCVQYDESEWNFIARLLEEEGIHFHFQQEERYSVMVISDHRGAFRPLQAERNIKFQRSSGQVGSESALYDLNWHHQVGYDQISFNDYRYEKPNRSLSVSAQNSESPSLERYRFPGHYSSLEEGDKRAAIELSRASVARCHIEAKGDICFFSSGSVFSLTQHPRNDFNTDLLIKRIHQSGEQPQVLEEQAGMGGYQFQSTISCIPTALEYRPPTLHKKTSIAGSHTAVVYGAPGETIYTDELGRIKVNFHWERENKSSCWLRVSQSWAGNQWGSAHLPRVGQEVLVDFVDGDPDYPVVTGSVYHRLHKPPYKLPDHKTRTTFKTQSVPSGGFNELRIEDKKGQEQIFVRAQRDLDLKILSDYKSHVGGSKHLIVDKNKFEHIEGESNLSVTRDIKMQTNGSIHTAVDGDRQDKVAGAIKQQAGGDFHIKAGRKIVLDAGIEMTIKAGGAFIKLSPAGVQIQGATINLNGGGSAVSASDATPAMPSLPIAVSSEGAGTQSKSNSPKSGSSSNQLEFIEGSEAAVNKRVHLRHLVESHQLLADECLMDEQGQCAKMHCTCNVN